MSDIKSQIKFGTDGWRAIIADDFTFANVRITAEAVIAEGNVSRPAPSGTSAAGLTTAEAAAETVTAPMTATSS